MALGMILPWTFGGLAPPRIYGRLWPTALTAFTLLIIVLMSAYSDNGGERDWMYFTAEAVFFVVVNMCRTQRLESLPAAINQVSTLSIVLFLMQWFQQGGMFGSTRAYIGDSGSPNQLANVAIAAVLTGVQLLFTQRSSIFQVMPWHHIDCHGHIRHHRRANPLCVLRNWLVGSGRPFHGRPAPIKYNKAQLQYVFWMALRIGTISLIFGSGLLLVQREKMESRIEMFEEYFVRGYQSFVLGEDNIENSSRNPQKPSPADF